MRRWIIAVLLAATVLSAHAGQPAVPHGRRVFVFTPVERIHHQGEPAGQTSPIVTGDTIPFRLVNTLLFVAEPCPLKIVGRRNMLRAWMDLGAYQLGCWFPLENGYYVFIDGSGRQYVERALWKSFPSALLNPNDTVTIVQPHYNALTYSAKVYQHHVMSAFKHEHEKP